MWSSELRRARPRLFKVGYVVKRFPRLSETFVLNEILELERQGFEVEVFSLKRPLDEPRHAAFNHLKARVTYATAAVQAAANGRETEPDFKLLSPQKTDADLSALSRKARVIASRAAAAGVQHLHAHFASDATTAAIMAARAAGLPFSFTAHARDIYHCYVSPSVDDRARRLKIEAASFVATVSDFNVRHLRSLVAEDHAGKVIRLYNGVDLDLFAPPATGQRRPRSILSVGRLVEKKGMAHLIEACRLLRQRNFAFSCDIVGDGPLHATLEQQVRSSGLAGLVHLRGALPQQDVLSLMHSAEVMVLPSVVTASGDQDGLPTVLLEALAAGLPAISTRVAGIPEIIETGRSGLLVDPGSPQQLAEALARVLNDADLAAHLARHGRRRAADLFDLKRNAGRLGQLFMASGATSHWSAQDDAYRLHLR